ncbi:zinc finger protein OZF-like isoform X2 [Tribolium madens]|uniref:zinc finger protein OZF-like isoform X2 n=1 Tax=Tribolium madens TaxID=41895 RepID=UPI001CF72E94|nr:zinc finger protein OZF-like isoform X2 [Tribolium madens]
MENKSLQIASDLGIEPDEIEIVSVNTICRLCGSQNERLIGIFSDEGIGNDLSNKINLYLPVKVAASDDLPLQCCWNCASTLLAWHELVVTSVETDRRFRNSQFIAEKQVVEDVELDISVNPPSDDNEDKDGLIKYEVPLSPPPTETKPLSPKRKTHSKAVCDICNKTLSRTRDLKRHKTSCHPDPKVIENRLQLKNHAFEIHQVKQKRQRRKKNEIVAKFFCDVCEKGFTRKHDMEKHRGRMHAEYELEQKEQSVRKNNLAVLEKCKSRDSDGKVFYNCDFCQRIFGQSYNLMRHRTVHTGVREYFCHLCGKSFRVSNGLKRHIEAFHNGVKNFSCEVCKRTFSARATRDEHMNIHTNNRPFVCDICGKSFKQKASLYVHKMFHTDTYRFECSYCGKKFRRNQDLKIHTWLHTGHRPHSCHKCKAAFRLRHDLTRHLRIHEKLNECVCNECGSVFSQERYLKVHKKIHKRTEMVLKLEEIEIKD